MTHSDDPGLRILITQHEKTKMTRMTKTLGKPYYLYHCSMRPFHTFAIGTHAYSENNSVFRCYYAAASKMF